MSPRPPSNSAEEPLQFDMFGRPRVRRQRRAQRPLTDDEIRGAVRPRGRRFWLGGGLALFALALILGSILVALAGVLILSLGAVPEIWRLLAFRGVRFERVFMPQRVHFGGETTVAYRVENRKWLPIPWLEIEDELTTEIDIPTARLYPSYKAVRQIFLFSMALWGWQRVTRTYRMAPLARGVWTFGPAYLRAGDPFGFLENERKIPNGPAAQRLMVLPLVAPLARFGLPSRQPFGDIVTRRMMLEDPSQVIGARDYQPGDSIRRVHWKATARATTLQSRVFARATSYTLAIFLDIRTALSPAEGISTPLFELGIAAAASIAMWAARHDQAVGLFSNGLPQSSGDADLESLAAMHAFMRVPPSQHPEQLMRVQSALARMQPYFGTTMARALRREQAALPLGATIVFITAAKAVQPQTIALLERMQRNGFIVAVLLTGDAPAATGTLLTYRLGGEEAWHELVTQYGRSAATDAADQSGSDDSGPTRDGAGNGTDADPANSGGARAGSGQRAFALG